MENPNFGFKCLNLSVNENKGSIEVEILNKKKSAVTVAVRTVDKTAKAGEDFKKVDKSIRFKKGQEDFKISIEIKDDDEWEPDKEFIVELYEPKTGYALNGKDTKCSITIIDDDNPGTLTFEKTEESVFASQPEIIVTVSRKNGCKGYISCKFKTIELEDKDNRAVAGEDYEVSEGTIDF